MLHKFDGVTRVEVIRDGREYVATVGIAGAEISIQDGGRTMKIFLTQTPSPETPHPAPDEA